jgi:chromate transporter
MKEWLELFITFLKMGCVTFGGGYAMIPVLEREIIRKKGWITVDEVMDYYTIAQITPGIIAVNISTFIGYKRKGAAGGIVSTAGFILPGVTLVTIITLCTARFADYPAIRHAFSGIRVAAGALVLDTVIKLCKGLFKDRSMRRRHLAFAIFMLAFALSAVLSVSPVLLVAGSGIAGFFLFKSLV